MFMGKLAVATSFALAATASAQALAADTSCKAVFDAIARQVMTPSHEYMIQTEGARQGKKGAEGSHQHRHGAVFSGGR
jgi:hypothetical protein